MDVKRDNRIRALIRRYYGSSAAGNSDTCECGDSRLKEEVLEVYQQFGYPTRDVAAFFEGTRMGSCCGNSLPFAEIQHGETVLDLGSGRGLDCYIAAKLVGSDGRVIGVDMTPELVSDAREHLAGMGYANVEVRLGEIEYLPVADESVDVIISNCVINLSPDKPQVFREAFRVLKPGGRLAVSDIVALAPLPDELKNDEEAYVGCIAGAVLVTELEDMLTRSGFHDVRIVPVEESRKVIQGWKACGKPEDYVVSAIIKAVKPHLEKL